MCSASVINAQRESSCHDAAIPVPCRHVARDRSLNYLEVRSVKRLSMLYGPFFVREVEGELTPIHGQELSCTSSGEGFGGSSDRTKSEQS